MIRGNKCIINVVYDIKHKILLPGNLEKMHKIENITDVKFYLNETH